LGHRRLDLWPRLQLFRIESERLKLPAPFNRRIAKPFDTDAIFGAVSLHPKIPFPAAGLSAKSGNI
jgi:hypothetical protein